LCKPAGAFRRALGPCAPKPEPRGLGCHAAVIPAVPVWVAGLACGSSVCCPAAQARRLRAAFRASGSCAPALPAALRVTRVLRGLRLVGDPSPVRGVSARNRCTAAAFVRKRRGAAVLRRASRVPTPSALPRCGLRPRTCLSPPRCHRRSWLTMRDRGEAKHLFPCYANESLWLSKHIAPLFRIKLCPQAVMAMRAGCVPCLNASSVKLLYGCGCVSFRP